MNGTKYNRTPADERQAVGVGLLGYKTMGKAHSNALRTIPYIFWPSGYRPELVAICGRSEEATKEAAVRYGYESYCTDWNALVEDERVQVFDNAATDEVHVEPTLAAIGAGKHVMCEKPLALSAADAERMQKAAEEAGVKNLTCFNYRFLPAVRLAHDMIKNGDLGHIHQARFRYSQEWRNASTQSLPHPTGALNIIGCHAIDQARFLVGEIERVSASMTSPVTTPARTSGKLAVEQDDTVNLLVEFEGGVAGSVDASLVSPGRKNMLGWEINGSKGSIVWDLENLNALHVYRASDSRTRGFTEVIVADQEYELGAHWWPSGHLLGWEHGHTNMVAHFLQAVAEDLPVEPYGATFADGAKVAQISEAARQAANTRQWVEITNPQRANI